MFDIRDAEVVREIVRSGGFRLAAQRLRISQSAVSARIGGLEARLGFRIFDRQYRGARLTPVGRRFVEQSERLIKLRDQIVATLLPAGGLAGTLRIGAAETIVHAWLPAMLNRLQHRLPRLRLELAVDTSPSLVRKLLSDDLDVALLMRQFVPDEVVSMPIYSCRLGWFAAITIDVPDTPLGLADLADYPIVTFSKDTLPYGEVERLFASPDLPVPLLHGCASLSTMLHLVRDGFGIGLLPVSMAEHDVHEGRLKRLATSPEARLSGLAFSLCYLPRQNSELITLLREAAQQAAVEVGPPISQSDQVDQHLID